MVFQGWALGKDLTLNEVMEFGTQESPSSVSRCGTLCQVMMYQIPVSILQNCSICCL